MFSGGELPQVLDVAPLPADITVIDRRLEELRAARSANLETEPETEWRRGKVSTYPATDTSRETDTRSYPTGTPTVPAPPPRGAASESHPDVPGPSPEHGSPEWQAHIRAEHARAAAEDEV